MERLNLIGLDYGIVDAIAQTGGTPIAVGGYVRDHLLGIDSKDIDIEVFNISPEDLRTVLGRFGTLNAVGVSFGVLKLHFKDGTEYDFTLPRRESKSGQGNRGFIVDCDPSMTFVEAARRRDYTINAMGINLVTGEFLDPFNGQKDLRQRILRAPSEHFVESPIRVLRGMQFAADST
jgi:tRNA nucleotidyltransferase (CCA-adding enzyme)